MEKFGGAGNIEQNPPVRKPNLIKTAVQTGAIIGASFLAGKHIGENTGEIAGTREMLSHPTAKESYITEIKKEMELVYSRKARIEKEVERIDALIKKYKHLKVDENAFEKLKKTGITNATATLLEQKRSLEARFESATTTLDLLLKNLHSELKDSERSARIIEDFLHPSKTHEEKRNIITVRENIKKIEDALDKFDRLIIGRKEESIGYKMITALEQE